MNLYNFDFREQVDVPFYRYLFNELQMMKSTSKGKYAQCTTIKALNKGEEKQLSYLPKLTKLHYLSTLIDPRFNLAYFKSNDE